MVFVFRSNDGKLLPGLQCQNLFNGVNIHLPLIRKGEGVGFAIEYGSTQALLRFPDGTAEGGWEM